MRDRSQIYLRICGIKTHNSQRKTPCIKIELILETDFKVIKLLIFFHNFEILVHFKFYICENKNLFERIFILLAFFHRVYSSVFLLVVGKCLTSLEISHTLPNQSIKFLVVVDSNGQAYKKIFLAVNSRVLHFSEIKS